MRAPRNPPPGFSRATHVQSSVRGYWRFGRLCVHCQSLPKFARAVRSSFLPLDDKRPRDRCRVCRCVVVTGEKRFPRKKKRSIRLRRKVGKMTVKILGPPYWKSLRSLAKQCDVSAHPREIAWPKLASSLAPRRDACRAPHGCDGGCSLTHFAALNTHPRPDTCACADASAGKILRTSRLMHTCSACPLRRSSRPWPPEPR